MGGDVQKGAGSAPVLEDAFLSPEVNWGDTMKLYFRASDPDGDMKWAFADVGRKVDDMGRAISPGANRLRGENQKSVSGCLVWDSGRAVAVPERGEISGVIAVWVEDAAGNSSAKKYLPVTIMMSGANVQKPPAGAFSEQVVGNIIIDTRTLGVQR
jgi:hypothetical protein